MRAVDLPGHCSRIGRLVGLAVLRTVVWSSTFPCFKTFLLNFSAVLRVECRGSPSSGGAEEIALSVLCTPPGDVVCYGREIDEIFRKKHVVGAQEERKYIFMVVFGIRMTPL